MGMTQAKYTEMVELLAQLRLHQDRAHDLSMQLANALLLKNFAPEAFKYGTAYTRVTNMSALRRGAVEECELEIDRGERGANTVSYALKTVPWALWPVVARNEYQTGKRFGRPRPPYVLATT